ncbi:MAG: NADH-quinone oxidoreductase subunit A [Bdellovibrionales bacterium]|nr:NADH-quinone oxidoreductase subunit A [Bdellovibrionales bacterium]
METGYITALWFIVISALTVPLMMGIGWLIRPKVKGSHLKSQPYECGEQPVGEAWIKFNIRFYVVAIIFIIFDVEVATVFPAMTLYKSAIAQGAAGIAFIKIFLFIGLLLSGLVYCWVRGDLEWIKGAAQGIKPRK